MEEISSSAENLIETQGAGDQYLTFLLNGEEYGLDILRVQEIRGWHATTAIPNAPDYVKGVINLRGSIVPIIDLRLRFGMTSIEYTPITVVIVVRVCDEHKERVMGIVVDAVSEVYNFTSEEVSPTPELGGTIDVSFIRGIASADEKMIMLLEIDQLLSINDMDKSLVV